MFAYALRRQKTNADLVCLITDDVPVYAKAPLELLFDHVVSVDRLMVSHPLRDHRADRPFLFARLNALRLGRDGDLGFAYDKVVLVDADILPLRRYDTLFALNGPAGIINERKEHCIEADGSGDFTYPNSVYLDGTWKWHRLYGEVSPHGKTVPRDVTDRVLVDTTNMGVNTSVMVVEPNMLEFAAIKDDLRRAETLDLIGKLPWPEMQYLTLRWSGSWTSIDLRYGSFGGYPGLQYVYGTHYAGLKPWSIGNKSIRCYGRHPDFRLWFRLFLQMIREHQRLLRFPALRRLFRELEAVVDSDKRYQFYETYLAGLQHLFSRSRQLE